ncbi:hypothetical protein AKO1_011515 [Acrasis kona]|uniref:KTI12 n=1 Tax=Acrasis kona TaxID=1008807 RepID=A0AAW2Z0F5_9EUKA
MPLIMLCGAPSSGKTTRTNQLLEHFKSKAPDQRVSVVSDQDVLLVDKNQGYKDSFNEKQTRGKIKAATERLVTKETIVIVDSMNYIKGYRYELYCVARATRTPHCVVYCETPLDQIKEWNSTRPSEQQYEENLLQELFSRIEVPIGTNRWDNPLFTLKPQDDLPGEDILNAMLHPTKTLKPNVSTLPLQLSDNTLMYELDKITGEVVTTLMGSKATSFPGDFIAVQHTTSKLRVPQFATLPELRKLRTKFIKISQMRPPNNKEEIAKSFVDFLNINLK